MKYTLGTIIFDMGNMKVYFIGIGGKKKHLMKNSNYS